MKKLITDGVKNWREAWAFQCFFPPPVSDLARNGLRIQPERRRGEVKSGRGLGERSADDWDGWKVKSLGREEEETAASVLRLAVHHQVSVLLGTAAPSAFLLLRVEGGVGWGRLAEVESNCCSFIQSFTFNFCPYQSASISIFPIIHFLLHFFFNLKNVGMNKQKTNKNNYKNMNVTYI